MKICHVVCGAIIQDRQYLIAKRGKGIGEDYWEFPGGKVEINESHEAAIIRELKEELNVDVRILNYVTSVDDVQDEIHLCIHSYRCAIKKGTPKLQVHKEMKWVSPQDLYHYNFQKADRLILDLINQHELL